MARPTKAEAAKKKALLQEKQNALKNTTTTPPEPAPQQLAAPTEPAPKIVDAPKPPEQKVTAAALDPNIQELEKAYNKSQGLSNPSLEVEEPVQYKAGEVVVDNPENQTQQAGANEPPVQVDDPNIDINNPIYQIPTEIEEPLMGDTIDRGYNKMKPNPAPATTQPAVAAGGGNVPPPPPPPVHNDPIIPEPAPIQPTVALPGNNQNPNANQGANQGQQNAGQPGNTTQPGNNSAQPGPKPAGEPNLQDLSPTQKRKNAEKTADALLKAYQNVMPVLPKWLATWNIPKHQRAEMRGEIDLKLVVTKDENNRDMRVIDYMQSVNQQCDALFVVTDDMVKEIKEPLVEVLMEKEFALTPTERLIVAVAQQFGMFAIQGFKIMQSNRAALEQFKAFHEENKKAGKGPPPNNPTQPGPDSGPSQPASPPQNGPVNVPDAESQPEPTKTKETKLEDFVTVQSNSNEDVLEEGKGFVMNEEKNND